MLFRFLLLAGFVLLSALPCAGAEGVSVDRVSAPRLVAAGDFDGDGRLDRAVATSRGIRVRLSLRRWPLLLAVGRDRLVAIAAGDFDRDGDPDLAALGASGELILCRNEAGRFSAVPSTPRAPTVRPRAVTLQGGESSEAFPVGSETSAGWGAPVARAHSWLSPLSPSGRVRAARRPPVDDCFLVHASPRSPPLSLI
jgi:hypothetical protein